MASAAKFKIESGVQLLARLSKKSDIVNFLPSLFEPGLTQGDTVEFYSNVSISYLLIDIISTALFPNKANEAPAGVLLINTVGQFNYEEFIEILRNKIQDQIGHMQNTNVDDILHKTLKSFHFLDIYDITQFYVTIHNLDNILMQYSNVSLLIFDTLTAFYWSEQGFKITKMDSYTKFLLTMIQKVLREYKIILMYTRPAYFSSIKDIDNLEISDLPNNLNFKIQVAPNGKGVYELIVKTSKICYKKRFSIINNIINWK